MENKMQIEYLSPEALIPSPHNARIHPPEQIQAIANNIRENGFLRPVLIDGENGIIGGHGGVEAAKRLGLPEIPCVRADHLTEAQVRAYMLADNRLAEMSYYDMESVSRELEALSEMGFDLAMTGFDLSEVQKEAERLEQELRRKECPTSLKDVFVVPPFSVLDTRQGYWQERKKQWLDYGIKSEVGRGDNLTFAKSLQMGKNDNGTSVFDPVLCEIMYRWFNVPGGSIFDPFAGGSVRGVVAKCTGYSYQGIDLRAEQVESNRQNAVELGLDSSGLEWICDDSRNMDQYIADGSADMVFTCPPYFDLEVYSDDPRDISGMDYEGFTAVFHEIMTKAAGKLKQDRFMVVVLSDVRGPDGNYRGIVDRLTGALREQGLRLYNDMILFNVVGSSSLRARRNMHNRKVVRTHQNVLVYYKGDTGNIQSHFPALEEITEENLPNGLDISG